MNLIVGIRSPLRVRSRCLNSSRPFLAFYTSPYTPSRCSQAERAIQRCESVGRSHDGYLLLPPLWVPIVLESRIHLSIDNSGLFLYWTLSTITSFVRNRPALSSPARRTRRALVNVQQNTGHLTLGSYFLDLCSVSLWFTPWGVIATNRNLYQCSSSSHAVGQQCLPWRMF